MSSVFQRNDRWYLRVRNAAGKRVKVASDARTKAEAVRLAGDLERKHERQRHGLEAMPSIDGGGTFAALMKWWLKDFSSRSPSHLQNTAVVTKHLVSSSLADLPLALVTTAAIETLLQQKSQDELGPQSLNHLRGYIARAFNAAAKVGRYVGTNPAKNVKKRRVPKALPEYLKAAEVPHVLAALEPRWRPMFACAIFAGLRKGELVALRKSDVDLDARLLSVARSGTRDTTKGAHADAIPIAAELVPFLRVAMAASPSQLMFPKPDGGQMRTDVKLAKVLRSALARADICTGWNHVCRARGCKHAEQAGDNQLRRCPVHNAKLWPKAQVRPIKFHALRHTTASLLIMAGANPAAVRKIMRHSDQKMTDIYSHLAPEYLRTEVDLLSLGVSPGEPSPVLEAPRAMVVNGEVVPKRSPLSGEPSENENPSVANLANTGVFLERRKGFEPSTPSLGNIDEAFPTRHSPSQVNDSVRLQPEAKIQPSQGLSTITRESVPRWSPRLKEVPGGGDNLLSVRDVAKRLRVSTATVYGLIGDGRLPHLRVSNAIRVVPADLVAFIAAKAG